MKGFAASVAVIAVCMALLASAWYTQPMLAMLLLLAYTVGFFAVLALLAAVDLLLPAPAKRLLSLRLSRGKVCLITSYDSGFVKIDAAEPTPEGTVKARLGKDEVEYPIVKGDEVKGAASKRPRVYVLEGVNKPVLLAHASRAFAANPGVTLDLQSLDPGRVPIKALMATYKSTVQKAEARAYKEAKALPVKSLLILGTLVIIFTFCAIVLATILG